MEHRIEPKESWWLAPWSRKKTYEKVVLLLGLVVAVFQTVEWYEKGYVVYWFTVPMYWFSLGWAYFSQSRSREVIVITELKLNDSPSVQPERRSPGLI